ncbi:hypothetical protein [Telmatospirillum siberiense]|uniref:Uncharacterized protein n=1 Tax=Telmatospirillum siberiense TaxID=382514 RepID=A0A2N3PS11_9PROT|nr:hypothetical protein [Telmatospirillum siberiense]PKU23164.1 hypothetical protein CWS72_18240 [Telmatospirillum siberiense]
MTPMAYLKIGGAALAGLLIATTVWYVGDLRTRVAEAKARIATQAATITVQQAAAEQNQRTIAALQAAKDLGDRAQAADARRQRSIATAAEKAKEHIRHVTIPDDGCRAVDARDADTLEQLRGLLATVSGGGDADGQDSAAGGADGGHSAAASAGSVGQP